MSDSLNNFIPPPPGYHYAADGYTIIRNGIDDQPAKKGGDKRGTANKGPKADPKRGVPDKGPRADPKRGTPDYGPRPTDHKTPAQAAAIKAANERAAGVPVAAPKATSSYAKYKANTQPDPFGAQSQLDAGLPDQGSKPIVTGQLGDLPGSFWTGSNGNISSSGDELLQGLYKMSPTEVKTLQQKFVDAGSKTVEVTGVVDPALVTAYTTILRSAQLYQTANPSHPMTPEEILDATIAAQKKATGTSVHETSSQVNLTDPVQAKQTLVAAMTDKLGRQPTDQEIAEFTSALNSAQQASPTTTDTTRVTNADGSEKSANSTTSGGTVDPSSFASNYVQSNHGPEAQAVAHLNWYNVALQALAGSSGIATGNPD